MLLSPEHSAALCSDSTEQSDYTYVTIKNDSMQLMKQADILSKSPPLCQRVNDAIYLMENGIGFQQACINTNLNHLKLDIFDESYKEYTTSDMENALHAVLSDTCNVAEASRTFNIPSRTLYYKLKINKTQLSDACSCNCHKTVRTRRKAKIADPSLCDCHCWAFGLDRVSTGLQARRGSGNKCEGDGTGLQARRGSGNDCEGDGQAELGGCHHHGVVDDRLSDANDKQDKNIVKFSIERILKQDRNTIKFSIERILKQDQVEERNEFCSDFSINKILC